MDKNTNENVVTSEDLILIGEAIKTQKQFINSIIENQKYDGEKDDFFINKCNELYDDYTKLFTRLTKFMVNSVGEYGTFPSSFFIIPIVEVEGGDINGLKQ